MKKGLKKAFTLVELIIVIAIIAILAVTAFLLLTKRLSKARDSSRASDLAMIENSLNIYYIENLKYPKPDNYTGVYTESGSLLWYQGEFGEELISILGNISNGVKDPNGGDYGYSLSFDTKTYQVSAMYENTDVSYMNKVHAQDGMSRIQGTYGEFIIVNTGTNYYLWHIPSLFASGTVITGNQYNYINQDKKQLDNNVFVKYIDITGLYTGADKTTILSGIVDAFSGEGITTNEIAIIKITNAPGGIRISADTLDSTILLSKKISAGYMHTCGVSGTGGLFCWGQNTYGGVGDGTTTDRHVPTYIGTGLTFSSPVVGGYHTCAITNTGGAFCWGSNGGAIGDGTTINRDTPTYIGTGMTFQMLSAGSCTETCGITNTGGTFCWGNNHVGELGDGTTIQKNFPTYIGPGLSFTTINVGCWKVCAISSTGGLFCWGRNYNRSRVGDGTITDRYTPTYIAPGMSFTFVANGGYNSCAISTTGGTFCWGQNTYGGVGDGTTTDRHVPTYIGTGLTFKFLSLGSSVTCGITNTGGTFCWGNNTYGELGDGTTTDKHVPTYIGTGLIFEEISVGDGHTCGISSTGGLFCWGNNTCGQIGDGTTTDRYTPTYIQR